MSWWVVIIRLLLAVSIGCVIGIDRERRHRPAGVRTHILLCVGAAIIAVMECLLAEETGASNMMGVSLNRGRLSAQVISGVGFLGAGTIFISQKKVAGLTTAASLWNVACLGLASGFGYYGLAAGGCIVVILVLTVMQRLFHGRDTRCLEIKFTQRAETMSAIDRVFSERGIQVADIDFHIENLEDHSLYTNLYTLSLPGRNDYPELVRQLAALEDVQSIHTINN